MPTVSSLFDDPEHTSETSMISGSRSSLSFSWFDHLLKNSPLLKSIEVCHAQLVGRSEELENLAKRIASHACLKELNLWFLQSGATGCSSYVPLLRVLSTLQNVVLDWNGDPFEHEISYSPEILSGLVLSPSSQLDSLVLGQVVLSDEAVSCMSKTLEANTSLTELGLSGCQLRDKAGMALGRMLQHNKSIKRFELCGNPNLGDEACISIAQGLHHNAAMKRLDFFDNDSVTNIGFQAIVELLQYYNTTLECVSTDAPQEVDARINFYLRLNRTLGRKNLLHETKEGAKEAWLQAMITHQNNLDYLFYFLSTNPSLCLETTTEKKVVRRFQQQ
jgi:hypothetical protein